MTDTQRSAEIQRTGLRPAVSHDLRGRAQDAFLAAEKRKKQREQEEREREEAHLRAFRQRTAAMLSAQLDAQLQVTISPSEILAHSEPDDLISINGLLFGLDGSNGLNLFAHCQNCGGTAPVLDLYPKGDIETALSRLGAYLDTQEHGIHLCPPCAADANDRSNADNYENADA